MVTTVKFSAFAAANLNDSSNSVVGLASGVNVKSDKWVSWSTSGRPATPFGGLMGYNTTTKLYEFWNGTAWTNL